MGNFKFKSDIESFKIKDNKENKNDEVVIATDIKLPDDAPARMKTLRADGKKWYLTVVYHESTNKPFALFCRTNCNEKGVQTSDAVERLSELARKKGVLSEHVESTLSKISMESNVSKLTRIISLNLRHGVSPLSIVSELEKMDDIFVGSFLFQVKKFLSNYIKDGEEADGETCASCGSDRIVYSEGCLSCLDCGGSKCG